MDDITVANRYMRQVSIATDLPYIDFLKRKFTMHHYVNDKM